MEENSYRNRYKVGLQLLLLFFDLDSSELSFSDIESITTLQRLDKIEDFVATEILEDQLISLCGRRSTIVDRLSKLFEVQNDVSFTPEDAEHYYEFLNRFIQIEDFEHLAKSILLVVSLSN